MVTIIYTAAAMLTAPAVSWFVTGATWPGVMLVASATLLRVWHRRIYPRLPRRSCQEWPVPPPGYVDTTYRELPPPAQIEPPQAKPLEGGW